MHIVESEIILRSCAAELSVFSIFLENASAYSEASLNKSVNGVLLGVNLTVKTVVMSVNGHFPVSSIFAGDDDLKKLPSPISTGGAAVARRAGAAKRRPGAKAVAEVEVARSALARMSVPPDSDRE